MNIECVCVCACAFLVLKIRYHNTLDAGFIMKNYGLMFIVTHTPNTHTIYPQRATCMPQEEHTHK